MAEQFLHGIEVIEIDDGIRPIATVKSAIIGLIGTAPDADDVFFPLNEPVAILGNPRFAQRLGAAGTLRDAIDRIFEQAGATVVVVRVEEGATLAETRANIVGTPSEGTGVWAFLRSRAKTSLTPRILIAPGFTDQRVNNGITDVIVTESGSGYLNAESVEFFFTPETGNTPTILPSFTAIVPTEGENAGKITEVIINEPGENITNFLEGPSLTCSAPQPGGVQATFQLQVGIAKNPVVAAMQSIAARLRAVIIADGPSTTDEAAVQYRGDYGDKRVYIVDPKVTIFDGETNSHVAYPASPSVAGIISRMDNTKGFWWSPSNQEIFGITGTSRPIDFDISDHHSQANFLNENEIATIIRHEGFRLWGNRTTSSDPLWAFLSVRRTADMIYESLEEAFLWAIDRPFSVNNIVEIVESVRAYLRHLVAVGAILGGNAWIDPTVNTKDQMLQGKLYVDFDIEPPAPIEHLIFRAHRNGDYYEELIDDVIRELSI
jgi:phage tail sheath protein FI